MTEEKRKIKMSFSSAPFPVAMSTLMAETGASVFWSRDCDETIIDGVYEDTGLYEFLLGLAKRNSLQLTDLGGAYFIGSGSKSDIVSTCVRVPMSDVSSLCTAFTGCLSEYGSVSAVGSCLVLSDYLYNVRRMLDMISVMREAGLRGYIAELFFIRMKDSDLLDIQAKLSAEGVDLLATSVNLDNLFRLVLDVSGTSSRIRVVNRPILYLAEGRPSRLEVGNEIQKSQSVVSSEGYSSISGYKSFSDGVSISLTPFRLTSDLISLDVEMVVSQFSESDSKYSDIPETSKSSIISPGVILADGSVYFLGSLQQQKKERGFSFFGVTDSKSDEIITVWVKIREINLKRGLTDENFSAMMGQ
ncbi:MAG: hypothetical protein Q4C70_05300 [Planctomycetia bacterium]|nr:hypothetical protein [Planctomycetia bacterium]